MASRDSILFLGSEVSRPSFFSNKIFQNREHQRIDGANQRNFGVSPATTERASIKGINRVDNRPTWPKVAKLARKKEASSKKGTKLSRDKTKSNRIDHKVAKLAKVAQLAKAGKGAKVAKIVKAAQAAKVAKPTKVAKVTTMQDAHRMQWRFEGKGTPADHL